MKKIIIIVSILGASLAIGAFLFFLKKENLIVAPETGISELPSSGAEEQNPVETGANNFTWEETPNLLDNFFPANKGENLKKVLDSVYKEYSEDYRLFSCRSGEERGLLLIAESNLENPDDPYFEARKSIREWEPYMASDLQFFLYPEITAPINSPVTFQDVGEEVRKGSFSTNEGVKNIYYGWITNYIAFTSSEECLHTAQQIVHPED